MPTSKPRVTVTLPQHVHDTISRLAALQGVSRGSILADLVTAVHPPLMRTVALIEAAQDAPAQVREGLRATIDDMERQAVASTGAGIAQLDWLLERVQGPAPEALDPPLVTRGSGLAPKPRKARSNKHLGPNR